MSGYQPSQSFSKILVRNSTFTSTHHLKNKLIKAGLLPVVCAICSLKPVWEDKLLILHLDHINGVRSDNRIENLRLVCPNCHSQMDTYCGKNKGINKRKR